MNFVNLGFPSGTQWADCNVGAEMSSCPGMLVPPFALDPCVPVDGLPAISLKPSKDGFHAIKDNPDVVLFPLSSFFSRYGRLLAGGIPSAAQWQELFDNCDREIENAAYPSVKFTSRINGNSLIIPGAGWFTREIVDEFKAIQNNFCLGYFNKEEAAVKLSERANLLREGRGYGGSYLTGNADTRFSPLGWTGGALAAMFEVFPIKYSSTQKDPIRTVPRNRWMTIRTIRNV